MLGNPHIFIKDITDKMKDEKKKATAEQRQQAQKVGT